LRLRRDVRFRRLADEAVVIRQDDGEVLVLNELGGRVLEWIQNHDDGELQFDRLLDDLQAEFDVSRSTLQDDALRFLGELVEAGVVERGGGMG
jgi:hypothetical protein